MLDSESGFAEFGFLQMRANETFNLVVGHAGEASYIQNKFGKLLLNGPPGGSRYSGGGGGLPMTRFVLTPGEGAPVGQEEASQQFLVLSLTEALEVGLW